MKGEKPKLCFIICWDLETIFTLRFSGETSKDVKAKLDAALATLPFKTLYRYLSFDSTNALLELGHEAEIEEVIDYPGAENIYLFISMKCKRKFFLPRDLETEEFADIDKQVQCLSILIHPAEKDKEEKLAKLRAKMSKGTKST